MLARLQSLEYGLGREEDDRRGDDEEDGSGSTSHWQRLWNRPVQESFIENLRPYASLS